MKKESIIYIFFILIISLTVFNWFKGNVFILGGDSLAIFRPVIEFKQDLFLWFSSAKDGLGTDARNLPKIFPYELFSAFGSLLGFSAIELQKILFYLTVCISGLSMFFLVYFSFRGLKERNKAAFLAALFYMFNTYVMFFKWPDRLQSLFSYMFFPLAFLFFIQGLKQKKNLIYSLGIAIVFLFVAPAATTPTYLVLIFIVLFLYYLFDNILNLNKLRFKQTTLFLVKSIILVVLFNFWWILPFFYNISAWFLDGALKNTESFQNTSVINSSNTSFLNIFRVMGYWALNDFYYPFLSRLYLSLPFVIISIFIPLIVFSSILIKKIDKEVKKLILFFFLLSLISLFFIKGVHYPFGEVNRWMFFNIPGFPMFRSQYEKLGNILVLGYSVLFGFATSHIYTLLKNRGRIFLGKCFILIIFLIFFVVNMFPFWTGQNIQEQRGHLNSQRVSIPIYYNDTYNWLNESLLDKRLLIFPLSKDKYGNINHQWGGANGNILSKLLGQSVVTKLFFDKYNELNSNPDLLIKNLPLINVKYIFIDYSRAPDLSEGGSFKQIDFPPWGKSMEFTKKFDQLKFYKINSNNFLPHFYTPQTLISTNQNIETLPQIISQLDYKIRSAIYLDEQNRDKIQELKKLPNTIGNTPVLEFKKINPIKYRIVVHNVKENFPLVFSESFHKGWKVYPAKPDNFQFLISNFQSNSNDQISNYKILDGNGDDQATAEELKDFIDKGYVSTLGDLKDREIKHQKWEDGKEKLDYIEKSKIDFISKNFQDTIQNDNLPDGHIWETWFKKPLSEENHLTANGYANSWTIETEKICKESFNKCVKNLDGTYDFELVVEFWPQRLFYVGLFISGTTLLTCVSYIIWDWQRRKKSLTKTKSKDDK